MRELQRDPPGGGGDRAAVTAPVTRVLRLSGTRVLQAAGVVVGAALLQGMGECG